MHRNRKLQDWSKTEGIAKQIFEKVVCKVIDKHRQYFTTETTTEVTLPSMLNLSESLRTSEELRSIYNTCLDSKIAKERMSRQSGSPPPSWYKYPAQGSAVGPPPMPNKPVEDRPLRSPERERRLSPGYDREAEWRRFQEWEKRNKKSPPRPSPPRHRPMSPRKERSPVRVPPPDWGRRSPPRSAPPEWRRNSPPGWGRRSPPHYGPPRGRSPPRSRSPPRWAPPPPEWERHRGYPSRRSPQRWGPHPQWDSRRERYPPPHPHYSKWAPPAAGKPQIVRPNGSGPPVPTLPVEAVKNQGDLAMKSDDGSAEEENLESFDLPDYDTETPIGQKYVIAVSGFFCKICHKFYNSESSAKITHCKSKTHYEKFSKWVSDKKEEALQQKRSVVAISAPINAVPSPVPPVAAPEVKVPSQELSDEPPSKIPKMEEKESSPLLENEKDDFDSGLVVKEEIKEESDSEANVSKYDPSEPTTEDNMASVDIKQELANNSSDQLSDLEKTPTHDGEFVEATVYNFRKMRVQQLKQNLQNRDLPLHGLKPLLLKRLEKTSLTMTLLYSATKDYIYIPCALLAEAKAAAEEIKQENKDGDEEVVEDKKETEPESEEGGEIEESGEPLNELTLTMHESDIEAANKKSQWITERELERELLQLEGIEKVIKMEKEENKMGKKTVVEWTISLMFRGTFPEDGLNFWMESHQHLPFRALLAD